MTSPDSQAASAEARTYTPGHLAVKVVFLVFSALIFICGCLYLWEPVGRMLNGRTVDARVAEIRLVEPGQPDIGYNYRREYPPERNLAISFRHYVGITIDGHNVLYRLSADSRKTPADGCNVNDVVRVAYYPDDPARVAFAVEQARTWGAATIFCGLGLFMLIVAVPMAATARKPIQIDHETVPAKA